MKKRFFCCLPKNFFVVDCNHLWANQALMNPYPFLNSHTAEAYVVRPTVALVLCIGPL